MTFYLRLSYQKITLIFIMQYKKYSKWLKSVKSFSNINFSQTSLLTLLSTKRAVMYAQSDENSLQGLNPQVTNLNLIRKVVAAASEIDSLKKAHHLQNNKLPLNNKFLHLKKGVNLKDIYMRDGESQLAVSQIVGSNGIETEIPGPNNKATTAPLKATKSLKFFLNKSYTKSLLTLHKTTETKPLFLGKRSTTFTENGLKPDTALFINTQLGFKTKRKYPTKASALGSNHMVNTVQPPRLVHKFENSYSKLTEINLITINLASANRIRQWAEKTLPNGKVVGEVINPETIHYKTLKPIKGGLFCERIFGPLKDHECACGKKFNIKNYLTKTIDNSVSQPLAQSVSHGNTQLSFNLQKRYFCRICDVEYTYSIIRRTQLGYIQLASPTTHVWFVKGTPSYISILLDMKKKHLQGITYNTETLTLENAFRGRQLLPVSPSSIFESWQKIMKTQYPEKYNLTNPDINKSTNTLSLNTTPEREAKTKFASSKPLNVNARKGIKSKKPLRVARANKFALASSQEVNKFPKTKKALYKQYLKNYYARKPKNPNKVEAVQLPIKSFGQKKELELKAVAKMQYILSKKGWFKLIQYVLKAATSNGVPTTTKMSLPQSEDLPLYKSRSQGVKTNIFMALNDNMRFLDGFLLLRSPKFLSQYLKNLDSQNPNIGLMSINTILSFSFNNLPESYKNALLKHLKIQLKSLVTPLYMLIFAKDRISPPLPLRAYKYNWQDSKGVINKLQDDISNTKKFNAQKEELTSIRSSKLQFLNASNLLKNISLKCYNFLIKFYNNQWSQTDHKPLGDIYMKFICLKGLGKETNSNKQYVYSQMETTLATFIRRHLLAQKGFLQNIVKLLKKSSTRHIVCTNLNSRELLTIFNHELCNPKLQTKKQLNPLFMLTTSLKSYTFNLLEQNLNKIALMLVLNLINTKETNGSFQKSTVTRKVLKKIKIWQLLTLNVKTKFLLKFFIYTTFTKPLGFIKQFNFLQNQKAYQSIKSIKNYVKLPCYNMESDLVGEINSTSTNLKSKNLFGSLYYCSSLKILKIFTLYFFFLKKTKKQVIYKLYTSVLADFKKLKNKYFRYLILSFTVFSYKKHLNLLSPLTTLLLQLSQKPSLHQMAKKTKTIFNFNVNSFSNLNTLTDTKVPAISIVYPGQSIKLLCVKFSGQQVKNSLADSNILTNQVVLFSANNFERYTTKGLISVKGSNIYLIGLTDSLIKINMTSQLSFSDIAKQLSLFAVTTLQSYLNMPQIYLVPNMWQSKIARQSSFIESFSQTKNQIVNNIYCLSHRELWEQDKDWQDFAYYYYSPGRITDKLIPLYKSRNYDALFSIDNTLSNTPQTEMYSLGMNINTAFSGAGLIQKLLNDFNFIELKKMDKQNRILLFQYNKHVQRLKKGMGTSSKGINAGNRKSRYQYYKACHIRDVLIRRTKLTRKIFNKLIPNDNFKTMDGQLTLKLASSKGASSSAEANKNISLVNRDGVSKLQALQNTTETNGLNMILTLLPVLPPVLRPVLKMSGQFTISDLNRLYQRIIYRNERLKKFLKDPALSSSFEMKYAQRLLQEAVDNLIQNGKSGVVPEKDARGRLLKSLSDILKGKQGRFRQYLLGKRVDYSGRSVIVVGPRLKLHECGIPKEMALVLYSPFLIKRILNEKLADTYLSAKKLIRTNPLLVSQLLREIMKSCPVLLNRAPTLHRLGFQAFQPKLVDGKAILLHPLVCPAFNADFDGDQMAVHVPITFEARAEAWKLMLARNNLLSPATGEPLILPSQDMVLGCYYLTTNCAEKWSKFKKGSGMYFHSIHDVLKAYNQQLLHLHAVIWVNIKGHLETANNMEQPLEIRIPLNQKYLYSQNGSYTPLAEHQWQLLANSFMTESNIDIPEAESDVNKNILNLTNLNVNYLEIYSKTHNLLNINQSTLVAQIGQIKDNSNLLLPQLTTQIIRTTPGKILFNILVKNAIEKRPRLLLKSSFKAGFIKNKLVNAIDHEIDNYFIRKNTAIS